MTDPTLIAAREAGEIAAKLTKAQREALLSAKEIGDGAGRPTRWRCQNAGRVRKPLLLAGLAYEAVPMLSWRSGRRDLVLTPLGSLVRDSLRGRG